MIKWIVAGVFIILIVAYVGYLAWQSRQPVEIVATRAYPGNVHFVPPNQCVGTYDNGVSVSWPAVNGVC